MKRLVFLLACSAACATNGFLQEGYGVKSKGMGGVGIALPQDSLVIAMNPAGLTHLCDRFDVGLHWVEHRSRHTERGSSKTFVASMEKSRKDLWWPEGGINWRFCPNQALGVAVFVAGQWEVKTFQEGISRGMEYGALSISPAYAWQFNPCHSFGVAVNVLVGRMSIRNNPVDAEQSVTSHSDKFLSNQGFDYEWGVNARFGWVGKFANCIQLGITYQTPTCMSLYRKYRGFIPAGGDADLPAQLGVGLAMWPFRGVVVSADVVHIFWRDGKLFRNANNGESGKYGANNGPGFGWNEQTVFKFGVAWDILRCLTVRIGYNYGNTPLPQGNPLNAYNMATIEDHVTAGGTINWGCNEFSVDYIYGFRHTISGPATGVGVDPTTTLIDRARSHSVGVAYGRRF